jgi:hypothetical protein
MAVDTAEKRYSMINLGDGTNIHLLFETDGTVDLDDRQHLLDCYSGIAFGAPPGINLLDFERAVMRGSNRGVMRGV